MSYARNLARLSRAGAPAVATAQDLRELAIYDGLFPPWATTLTATGNGDGGGLWRWDAASAETDDLGRVLLPAGRVDPGRWIRVTEGYVTPEMYGANGDGTNDTAALQAAGESGFEVRLSPKTYGVSKLDFSTPVVFTGTGWGSVIKCIGHDAGAPVMKLSAGAGNSSVTNLTVDANDQRITAIEITIGADHVELRLRCINVGYDQVNVGDNIPSGIKAYGDSATIWAEIETNYMGGTTPEPEPRAVSLSGNRNTVQWCRATGDGPGVIVDNVCRDAHIEAVEVIGSRDNGLYILDAERITIGSHYYDGIEEPCVIKGKFINIGRVVLGPQSRGVGVQDSSDVVIDSLIRLDDSTIPVEDKSRETFFYSRPNNTLSERITINSITGPTYGDFINIFNGTVHGFTVRNVNVIYYYAGNPSQSSNMMSIEPVTQFEFSDWNVGIVDLTASLTNPRYLRLPGSNCTGMSKLSNIHLWSLDHASYPLYMTNWKDPHIIVEDVATGLFSSTGYISSRPTTSSAGVQVWAGSGTPADDSEPWAHGDLAWPQNKDSNKVNPDPFAWQFNGTTWNPLHSGQINLTEGNAKLGTSSGGVTRMLNIDLNADDLTEGIRIESNTDVTATAKAIKVQKNAANVAYIERNGEVAGTGPFVELSDAKTKDNIESIGNAVEKLKQIKARRYTRGGKNEMGFVAQELAEVLPEAVTPFDEGLQGIKATAVLALAVSALQDLLDDHRKRT